jgi:hypothetical protein
MEPCRTCGATIPEAVCDVYCAPCLEVVYEALAEALLQAALAKITFTSVRS